MNSALPGLAQKTHPAGAAVQSRPPVAVLGVPFDNLTIAEAVAAIEELIATRRPHYVVTANVDFLVQAQNDIELRRILFDAPLVLCDGTPVLWASRLLGNALPERVAGSDLVPLLVEVAARKRYRLFFLGASPESASKAVARLSAKYPELIIAGQYSPPFNKLLEMDHEAIQRRILESRPDLLFVSFGCPKQEKWIAMHYRVLGVPVSVGVGGTIDFLAGQLKRAPRWMRRTGTEWLFRLLQEPRRLLRRYAHDLWGFSWRILRQWVRLRLRRQHRRRTWNRARSVPAPGVRPSSGAATAPSQAAPGGANAPVGSKRAAPEDGRTPGTGTERAPWTAEAASPGSSEEPLSRGKPDGPPSHAWKRIRFPEQLDSAAAQEGVLPPDAAFAGQDCLLDASHVRFIDSTGVGLLARWQKIARASGNHLILLAPSPAVQRALATLQLDGFFDAAPDLAAAQQLLATRVREQSLRAPSGLPEGSLVWEGEVTAANAEAVWEFTRARLGAHARQASGPLTLDLSRVRFIDSSGLGLMVRAKKLAAREGMGIVFTGLQPAVRNVIRLAQLEDYLLRA